MDTKKLRQKILDLAIRGKLVPQDPNDEPASVLLERIRAEKQQLIKEGKIKAPRASKASDTSHYGNDNPPFDIPEGWVWCKVEDIGDVITGNTPSKSVKAYYGGTIPFYKPNDLEQGFNTIMASDSLTKDGFVQSRQLPKDSILVTCIGATIGKTGIIRQEGSCNQQINAIVPGPLVNPEFVYYVCISDYFQRVIKSSASATTLPILNKNNFSKLLLPIPPFQEQIRITSDIAKWFAVVDKLDNELSNLQSDIEKAKSSILTLAISGKLVPQDPTEEPAIDLLRRINPDFAPCDNSHYPFEIPSSWAFVSGKEIFIPMRTCKPTGDEFLYIDIDSVDNKNNVIVSPKRLRTENAPSRASRFTQKGDVVFSMVRPYLKNIAVVPENNCIASTGFYVCSPNESLCSDYLYFMMLSPYVVDGLNKFMKGDNSPSINTNNILQWKYPIPPLKEQNRIVEEVQRLFSYLDKVESLLAM